jgi:phosphatidylserine decarboxylase
MVVPAAAVSALGAAASGAFPATGWTIAVAAAGFAAFTLYFFRDPDRPAPTDATKIYAPGDGVVLSVAREGPAETVTVRIFLSIFNVHVQRAPCAGKVTKVQTVAGSFAAAMKDAARGNARVVMTVEPGDGKPPIVVEQIAGLIARRIECWPKPGDTVEAGQRYGVIYFGSQAAVHLPAGAKATARPGQPMTAGVTEIGEWIAK